jgi:hypothetical protein
VGASSRARRADAARPRSRYRDAGPPEPDPRRPPRVHARSPPSRYGNGLVRQPMRRRRPSPSRCRALPPSAPGVRAAAGYAEGEPVSTRLVGHSEPT